MEHCEMTNILSRSPRRGREKGKGLESLFKVTMAENFLHLKRKWMEIYWTYKRTSNKKKSTLRHNIIKLSKVNYERILKAARESDLSQRVPFQYYQKIAESLQKRMRKQFKEMKEKKKKTTNKEPILINTL